MGLPGQPRLGSSARQPRGRLKVDPCACAGSGDPEAAAERVTSELKHRALGQLCPRVARPLGFVRTQTNILVDDRPPGPGAAGEARHRARGRTTLAWRWSVPSV